MTECRVDSERRGWPLAAQRLAGWTSNLLVLAVVSVVGLTFGRQLTSWWAVDSHRPPETVTGAARMLPLDPLGGEQVLHLMEFGDLPLRLGRQTLSGTREAAFTALREQCRRAAERGVGATRDPGREEQKMLQGIAGLTPVDEAAGVWKMYQVDGPLPLVVVTDSRGAPAGGEAGTQPTRALAWGLALPQSFGSEWTLFTCVPTAGLTAPAADPLALPMPPGATRAMSMRSEDGGGMLVLGGAGNPDAWLAALDTWFREHGWSADAAGSPIRGLRHRRYAHPEEGFAADIVLEEEQAKLRVMLTVTRQ